MPRAAHTLLQSNLISAVVEKFLNLPLGTRSHPGIAGHGFPWCQQILRHLSGKSEQQQLLHVHSIKKSMFHHIEQYLNYLHSLQQGKRRQEHHAQHRAVSQVWCRKTS